MGRAHRGAGRQGCAGAEMKITREPDGKPTTPRLQDAYDIFDAAMIAFIKSGAPLTLGGEKTEHESLFNRAKFAWMMAAGEKPTDDRRGRPQGTTVSLIDDSEALSYARSLPRHTKGRARCAAKRHHPSAEGDYLDSIVRRLTRKLKSGATK